MFTNDHSILGKSFREHVGGRWAISLLGFFLYLPLSTLSILSNASSASTTEFSPRWWLVALVGNLVFGVVIFCANVTVFRRRRALPVPVWWVVLLGTLAGGWRGFTVGVLAGSWDLDPGGLSFIGTRIVTGAVLGAVLLPGLALILSSIQTYRDRRDELMAQLVLQEREAIQAQQVSQTLMQEMRHALSRDLQQVTDSAQARDLSHQMWGEEKNRVKEKNRGKEKVQALEDTGQRLSWWKILRTTLTNNPYPTVPVVAIWTMSAIGTLTLSIGFVRAMAQILFSCIVISCLFWLGKRLNPHPGIPALFVLVTVLSVTVFFTSFVASWIFDPRPWPAGLGLALTNAMWLPALSIACSLAVSVLRSSESVIAQLEKDLDLAEIRKSALEAESREVRKKLARQLHGSVQSRLLISAALMDNPDIANIMRIPADEIHIELEPDQTTLKITPEELEARLGAIAQSWQGLMSVHLQVCSVDEPIPGILGENIEQVVHEGLANAFRHGKASAVDVKISGSPESLLSDAHAPTQSVQIDVVDNGIGLPENFIAGLGLRLVDSMSASDWRLSPEPLGGCRLTVELSYQ